MWLPREVSEWQTDKGGILEYRRLTMAMQCILTEYIEQAMAQAIYDKLEDATFAG